MKAIYISIRYAYTRVSFWSLASKMYNKIGLECKSVDDAKGYSTVILCVLVACHPIFIVPAVATYFSRNNRAV